MSEVSAAKSLQRHACPTPSQPAHARHARVAAVRCCALAPTERGECDGAPQHVQHKLDDAMRNLEDSLDKIRAEMALLGSASMEGCVVCWVELVRRLAGVRATLQDQMASINTVTMGLADTHGMGGEGSGGEEEGSWGLSPREWADYTMSEVASVTTALNNGIAASKRALTHASSRLHHELLQDVYNQMSGMRGMADDVLHDIFPDRLLEQLRAVSSGDVTGQAAIAGVEEASMERWPIVMFLLSAVTCLTTSASYHLFNCHSLEVRPVRVPSLALSLSSLCPSPGSVPPKRHLPHLPHPPLLPHAPPRAVAGGGSCSHCSCVRAARVCALAVATVARA